MPYASSIQVINDANGTAHAFLADNGAIWQCQWNAEAQRWDQGSEVPGALGGDKLQALYVSNLWPTESTNGTASSQPGIVLAYQVGKGNGAEVFGSLGVWGSDGRIDWSAPVPLTDDQVEDQAFALVEQGNGNGFSLVVQKQEADAPVDAVLDKLAATPAGQLEAELKLAASADRADSDLYATQFEIQSDPSTGALTLNDLTSGSSSEPLTPLRAIAPTAPSPSPFSGNTQLSRQNLVFNPAPSSNALQQSSLMLQSEPLMQSSSVQLSSSPDSSDGGKSTPWAGKQTNYNNGRSQATLSTGALFGQNLLRWVLPHLKASKEFYEQARAQEENPIDPDFSSLSSEAILDVGEDDLPAVNDVFDGAGEELSFAKDTRKYANSMLNPPLTKFADDIELGSGLGSDALASTMLDTNILGWKTSVGGGFEAHGHPMIKGTFGLANIGNGGPMVLSVFKGGYEYGNANKLGLQAKGKIELAINEENVRTAWIPIQHGTSLGGGLTLRTAYQFQGRGPQDLTSLTAQESGGFDADFITVKMSQTGGSISLNAQAGTGVLLQQILSAKEGENLPGWLGDIAYGAGMFADIQKNAAMAAGFGIGIYGGGLASDASHSDIVTNDLSTHAVSLTARKRALYLNAAVGSGLAAFGPASSLAAYIAGTNTLLDSNLTRSYGFEVDIRLTFRYLWKSVIGFQANLANRYDRFFAGAEKGTGEDTFFVNLGVALPMGGSIPLLSYMLTKELGEHSNTELSQNGNSDSNTQAQLGESSVNTNAVVTKNGAYVTYPSGNNYPFAYTPQSGSSSYLADIPTGQTNSKSNVSLLGGQTNNLTLVTLMANQAGQVNTINPANGSLSGTFALTLYNAGSGLNPGQYTDIPVFGITADGTKQSAARVNFNVGSNGQIVAASFQIVGQGSYIDLPETSFNSGVYALMLDVFSTGIATPPAPGSNSLSVLSTTPLLTLDSSRSGAPIQKQLIERVATVNVPEVSSSDGVIYPLYDPISNQVTPPASTDNSTYTYSSVAVQLFSSSSPTTPFTPLTLLNPGASGAEPANPVTATVTLNAGTISKVTLDQPLLFANQSASTSYKIQLGLPDAVVASLPTGTAAPSYAVQPQALGYSNFVADEQFSAQENQPNAGVYLASGISDLLPVEAAMAAWPVQNRVTYVTNSLVAGKPQANVVYLNATTTNSNGVVTQTTMEPSDVTPEALYNSVTDPIKYGAVPSFSAASSPTAIGIVGDDDKSLAGTTFVAWVEASDPVVPNSTPGNGATNFQNFMEALYGDQRINFRINFGGDTGWRAPNINDLYTPEEPAIIRHLQAFSVPNPDVPGGSATLLAWSETSIAAIKGTAENLNSGLQNPAKIKVGWINPNAESLQWNDLFTDEDGNSTIQTIPWNSTTDVGLTINDIAMASQAFLNADQTLTETPVITWSQEVRTPYRQSVLQDAPKIYLQFNELESGINDINLGSVDSSYTDTYASDTGLTFAIQGALSASQATAVQNSDGTGVLTTGLGTTFSEIRHLANNIPLNSFPQTSGITNFTGSIAGNVLTVTAISTGQLAVGDLLSGAGLEANTSIIGSQSVDAAGLGTYLIDQDQTVASTTMQAIDAESELPVSSFTGSINGNTLVLADGAGSLAVGDLIAGEGLSSGTMVVAVNKDDNGSILSYTLNKSCSEPISESAFYSSPGVPSTPYTIEFWAKLEDGSNPNGAGLVAYGQPSVQAVGEHTLPQNWLLNASFLVDRLTYEQAAAQGLITEIPSNVSSDSLYGWQWGVVATGANTTAEDGSGSGSNLYNNALVIANLASGAELEGVNQFLENYQLTAADLQVNDQQVSPDKIASVPQTQLQFANALNPTTQQPDSYLNGIAIDTNSATLNQGLIPVNQQGQISIGSTSTVNANLTAMFEALWEFQQKTGEAKVNFSVGDNGTITTTSDSALPNPYDQESYDGYDLRFVLSRGTAVSVNGDGQLVFDIGDGSAITSQATDTLNADLRDGQWHYIVASYLPTYQTYVRDGIVTQLPTNVGTASLYVDNQLVASDSEVFNPYPLINLNDQAMLLANNDGGAIDQLAIYSRALSSVAFQPITSNAWPAPGTRDALAILAELGYSIETQTPDPGAIPGAVNKHWAARTVNPNDAALATYTSSFDSSTGTWTQATTLNPILQLAPTSPSYTSGSSLQDALVITVPTSNWSSAGWQVTTTEPSGSSTSSSTKSSQLFTPANDLLTGVSLVVTNLRTGDQTSPINLTPDQVLIGDRTLRSLQPLSSSSNFNYTVLTNTPAISLVVPKKQLPASSDPLKDEYKVTYSFTFAEQNTTYTVSTPTAVTVNNFAGNLAEIQFSSSSLATDLAQDQTRNTALATAAVIEQAPLQLKYIDSGVILKSASTTAAANSPAVSAPANSFGQSQVVGSYIDSSNNSNGWLAIAQPFSTNAVSNPAGRIWIQYTGQSNNGSPSSTVAQAPTTWLNALADSNFSPESPNLPLLGDANNPSSTGGLLIQADPTQGWGQNFGQTMLVADVNGDSVSDLIIAAPQANGGGRVMIIDGTWIKTNLNNAGAETILNLSNPPAGAVTVLTPEPPQSGLDFTTVANFGSAIAFDSKTKTLWIGAPNYLRQLNPRSDTPLNSLQPIGALYSYTSSGANNGWNTGTATPVANPVLGSGGTVTTIGANNEPQTNFWGSQLGTAIAVNADLKSPSYGALAVSAPGVQAFQLFGGSQSVQQASNGNQKALSSEGNGALIKIQLPSDPAQIEASISNKTLTVTALLKGEELNLQVGDLITGPGVTAGTTITAITKAYDTKNSSVAGLYTVSQAQTVAAGSLNVLPGVSTVKGVNTDNLLNAEADTTYMQNLQMLQVDDITEATYVNNQAIQTAAVGAVYLFNQSFDLSQLDGQLTAKAVAKASDGAATFYGPLAWNTLGDSGFGASLSFGDYTNKNDQAVLSVGATQAGGSGAVYMIDLTQNFTAPSNTAWVNNINLGHNQFLAHQASGFTLYGAESADNFGNGLVNLGDVNNDGYQDQLIQAFNASSGSGNGYVVFGSDQLISYAQSSDNQTIPNQATGNVALSSIGNMQRAADSSSFTAAILNQLGSGNLGYTGQGTFGAGDVNGDGLSDIPLGSGTNGNAYLTWGHPYLEAITSLQLSKLSSDTGYLLDGLATSNQGSLRSVGDFNGDGYGDFISISPGSLVTNVRLELGGNTQEVLADYPYNYYSFTIANGTEVLPGGDINGDGMDDIVLFLDQNLTSAADGNQGAGSSTGILYGRSSNDLPLGSGFGFIAPVDPSTSAPLAPLPGDYLGGLTDAAPSVIAVGDTLYVAVKGDASSTDTSIWFTQSTDGGNTWNGWTDLTTSSNAGFSTSTGPSLAFYNEKLYLSFLNTDSIPALSLSSWDPTSNNPAAWSTPYELSNAANPSASYSSSYSPQLIERGDALGITWTAADDSSAITWSNNLASASSPSSPALAMLGSTVYMAIQGANNSIQWTSSTDNGANWTAWQTISQNGSSITTLGQPSLAVMDGILYLSYINSNQINITSLTGTSSNTWSESYVIPGQSNTEFASLINEQVENVQQLAAYYVDSSNSQILKTYSTSPSYSTGWTDSADLQYQTASGPLALTSYAAPSAPVQTYIAYQAGTIGNPGDIYVTTPRNANMANKGNNWESKLAASPGIATGIGLSGGINGLYLSYGNSGSPSALQIAQIYDQNGSWTQANVYNEQLSSNLSNNVSILQLSETELLLAAANTPDDVSGVQAGTVVLDNESITYLYSSYSTTPDGSNAKGSWATPTQLLQRTESDSSINFVPITTTDAPSASWLGGVPVLALNNNGTINVYAGAQSGGSLELTSSFTASSGEPAISSAPVLTTTDTGLALTYTNSDGSITLERLNFVSSSGAPLPGVQFNSDGSINTSNADLQWQSTTLTAANSGISTALASTPVSVNGNLLLTNVRDSGGLDNQIWINAVPNASDPDSTTWLNSTIQLPDSSSGWSISQQTGTVNIGTFTPQWTGDNGGLSPSAPAFAELNGVLYAAVVGDDTTTDSNDGLLFWNSSTDGGQTWSSWQQVLNGYSNTTTSPTNIAYAGSYQAPSLTAFDGAIYMGYVGTNNDIYIASLTDTEVMVGDSATNYWTQVQVNNQECKYIAITSENNELAAYYVGTNNDLYRTATSNPTSGSGWSNSLAIQYSGGNQTASGNLAVTTVPGSGSNSDTTYIAYQGGTPSSPSDTLYLTYSSTQSTGSSSSWNFAELTAQPTTANRGGVSLSNNSAGLLLGYPDKLNDELVYVVQQSANSGSTWSSFTTLEAPTGSSLPSSGTNNSFSLLASANSNAVLVGAINNGTGYNNAINTTIVSELPTSTSLSSSQTQSTLSAVGDLNGDGFDDLLVAANNVIVNPSSSSPTLATGLRLISGAATSSQILNNNNPSTNAQSVQLAPWQGLSNSTPVASLSGNGQLTVTSTDSQSGRSQSNSAALPTSTAAFTATAGDTATAQQLFQSNAAFTIGQPTAGIPLGDLALISTAGFGDLNGDGYEDYLDPTSATVITGANSQSWTLWSIRAAGDVNGNGVDDVLLSLAPQGPAYVPTSSDQPSALQSVLVDGSLFEIDQATNSFRLDQLKTPLNPYNRAQLYDVAGTSTTNYLPSLQNWFDPILGFKPGSMTKASTGTATNPASADSYSPPCAVVSPEGQTYLFFSGADTSGTSKASGLWMAYQENGIWQQASVQQGSSCNNTTPSATYFQGKLYVAYTDINQDVNIAVCSGSPQDSSSWNNYKVYTTTNESTAYSPTLIAENGRLALYFPTNNDGGGQDSYNTNYQMLRYLYSNDPSNSGSNGSWGSAFDSTTGSYSGISGQLNYEVTSPIAATNFQGRTVLAFRSYTTGGGYNTGDGDIILLTQVASAATATSPTSTLSWQEYNTGVDNVNGVGLTTDQALLYLTSSPNFGSNSPSSEIYTLAPSLNTAGQADGTWSMSSSQALGPDLYNSNQAAQSTSNASNYNTATVNPFMLNGQLMGTWTDTNGEVQIANLTLTIGGASQQSIAGYSIDGNIDVNGDGFTDILLSDPSDPAESVNNQYVLFGGDYLNIASQVGTPGDDTMIGTPLADVIYTLGGSDQVQSNGGADVIYTGSGDDQISITGNSFIRIDAGSGFDKLLLQGLAGQDYNFYLNVTKPDYFAGTKLQGIELINSADYGSNTLSFDAAAVNAINPDRILFLTPDNSDLIALSSEFQRNSTFDTNYGGVLWSAYASGEQASSTSDSPALVYVLNPDGATNANWLSTNVSTTDASSTSLRAASTALLEAPDPTSEFSDEFSGETFVTTTSFPPTTSTPIPTTSAVLRTVPFGSGLILTSYRTNPSDAEARFSVSSSDTSKPRALLYAISSANSSAEPGRHYTAIAGVAVLAKGQSSFDITVPINGEAFSQLRNGTLSLQVEEIPYSDRLVPLHLLIDSATSAEGDAGLPPVLSGFSLSPDPNGGTASLEFRADTNDGSADALKLSIARRSTADATSTIAVAQPSISDATTEPTSSNNALIGFDQDILDNGQVAVNLKFNLHPRPSEAYLSLRSSNDTALDLIELGQKPSLSPPLSTSSTIDYNLVNSGLADFSTLSKKQIRKIDWSSVDFESVAQSPDSAATLNAATINYKKLESNDFQAISSFINVDQLTGANIRTISKNSAADTYMNVEFIGPGQLQSFNGSDAIDLIYVKRGAAEITASGGAGDDLFYINSKRSEITITDFSEGDVLNLSSFQNRAILNGKLSFVQYGDDIRFTYNNRTVATLLDADIDKLSRNSLTFVIQPTDPLA